MKTKIVTQICNCCNKKFRVMYSENGAMKYIGNTCTCESDYSPIDGEPSIGEWLQSLNHVAPRLV